MDESRESSFLAFPDKDVNKIWTSMVIKYLMEWIETACIFILVEEDAFRDPHLMHNESNFVFSSDLEMTEWTDNTQDKAMLMLDENDIPGASLNGRGGWHVVVRHYLVELIDRYIPVKFSCFISMYLISISVCLCLSLPLSLT